MGSTEMTHTLTVAETLKNNPIGNDSMKDISSTASKPINIRWNGTDSKKLCITSYY